MWSVFCLTDKEAVQQFETRIKSERKQQNDKVKTAFTFKRQKSSERVNFSVSFLIFTDTIFDMNEWMNEWKKLYSMVKSLQMYAESTMLNR